MFKVRGLIVTALAAALGVIAVGGVSAMPNARTATTVYDCAKVAPGSQLTRLTDSFAGTYTLKSVVRTAATGQSYCDYKRSDVFPAGFHGTASLWIISGATAARRYGGTMQTAKTNFGRNCAAIVASGQPRPTDPRQCGVVLISGLGTKAYASGLYVAVLRGTTFFVLRVDGTERVDPATSNTISTLPTQEQLVTWAGRILARMR